MRMPDKTPRNRFTSRGQANARFVAQRGLLKGVVWGMMRVTVIDKQKLRGLKRPFVAVANHSSHLDAPLIMGAPFRGGLDELLEEWPTLLPADVGSVTQPIGLDRAGVLTVHVVRITAATNLAQLATAIFAAVTACDGIAIQTLSFVPRRFFRSAFVHRREVER